MFVFVYVCIYVKEGEKTWSRAIGLQQGSSNIEATWF
jgi:hypothetical protein